MTIRVVQWTTGNVGQRSVQAVMKRSDLELVGCYAWSAEKAGRDVGELCGIDPLGVTSTGVVDEATGTVRLKKQVEAADAMALDSRSTKTVRTKPEERP